MSSDPFGVKTSLPGWPRVLFRITPGVGVRRGDGTHVRHGPSSLGVERFGVADYKRNTTDMLSFPHEPKPPQVIRP